MVRSPAWLLSIAFSVESITDCYSTWRNSSVSAGYLSVYCKSEPHTVSLLKLVEGGKCLKGKSENFMDGRECLKGLSQSITL